MMLSVLVGTGVQLIAMAVITMSEQAQSRRAAAQGGARHGTPTPAHPRTRAARLCTRRLRSHAAATPPPRHSCRDARHANAAT